MHPYIENELNNAVEEMEENQVRFSKKQTDFIKSLPEKDRLNIYNAMVLEKKESSAFAMWQALGKGWRNFIAIVTLMAALWCLVAYGPEKWREAFEGYLQFMGFLSR